MCELNSKLLVSKSVNASTKENFLIMLGEKINLIFFKLHYPVILANMIVSQINEAADYWQSINAATASGTCCNTLYALVIVM